MTTSTYVIIGVDFITQDMIDEAVTDQDKIRYSSNNMAILEFENKFPVSMFGFKKYTHQEILEEIKSPEWSENE